CVRALCEGFNAKENLKNMNSLVLKRLLFPLSFPENVVPKIGQLNAQLDSLAINAEDLKVQLRTIQQLLGS
ncbi:extracellular tyrosine-protein kinase PKDCC, partial [Biomphalaria pfeifferi]